MGLANKIRKIKERAIDPVIEEADDICYTTLAIILIGLVLIVFVCIFYTYMFM